MRNNVYSDIMLIQGYAITCIWKKNENFQNFMYNIYDKLWGRWHHQLTHLNIHKEWSRNVFPKKCEISKCHNCLISYPIFIIFAPICGEIFTLSFEIMLILDWTSPLSDTKRKLLPIVICLGDNRYTSTKDTIHAVSQSTRTFIHSFIHSNCPQLNTNHTRLLNNTWPATAFNTYTQTFSSFL